MQVEHARKQAALRSQAGIGAYGAPTHGKIMRNCSAFIDMRRVMPQGILYRDEPFHYLPRLPLSSAKRHHAREVPALAPRSLIALP